MATPILLLLMNGGPTTLLAQPSPQANLADSILCAEKGDPVAMDALARCYRDGVGVPKDDVQAATWFRLASAKGSQDARKALEDPALAGIGFPPRPDLSNRGAADQFAQAAQDFVSSRFTLVARNRRVLIEFLKLYPDAFEGFISCRPGPETPSVIARVKAYLNQTGKDRSLTKFEDQVELMTLCFDAFNDWDANKKMAESLFHRFPNHVSRKLGLDIQGLLDSIQAEWNTVKADSRNLQQMAQESRDFEDALAESDYARAALLGRTLLASNRGRMHRVRSRIGAADTTGEGGSGSEGLGTQASTGNHAEGWFPFFKTYQNARWAVLLDCEQMALLSKTPDGSFDSEISRMVRLCNAEAGGSVGVSFIRLAEPVIKDAVQSIETLIQKAPALIWPSEKLRQAKQPFDHETGDNSARLTWLLELRRQLVDTVPQLSAITLSTQTGADKIIKSRISAPAWARIEESRTFLAMCQSEIKVIDRKISDTNDYMEHPVAWITIAGIEKVTMRDRVGNNPPSFLYTFVYNNQVFEAVLYYSDSFIDADYHWKSYTPIQKGSRIKIKIDTPYLNNFEYIQTDKNPVSFLFQIWSRDLKPVSAHPGPIVLVRRANGLIETRN